MVVSKNRGDSAKRRQGATRHSAANRSGGGNRRSGSETRKRVPIIGFRASEEERARIEAAAERAGLTIGSYVRSRALRKPTTRAVRRPSVQTVQLSRLLGLLGAVGGDVSRIAKSRDAGDGIANADLTASLKQFRKAASAIMRALGKKPHDY
jgi:hypothetical protein